MIRLHFCAVFTALLFCLPAFSQPMTVVLKLKERISMEALAQSVQNPHSPRFHKFYSPSEIRDMAAPSPNEYNQLLAQLKQQGFTILKESPTHLWIFAQAPSEKVASLFSAKINFLNSQLHQSVGTYQIPANLSLIESVDGLDNTRKSHPKFRHSSNGVQTMEAGVPQAKIKTAYGFDPLYASGLTGKGQHIAIATYDGFHLQNVQKFYTLSKLNPMPSVDQVDFNGVAKYNSGSAMETELDAELSGMIATGANIHVFPSATNDDTGETQMFTAILDDNRAKVVNYSWGACEKGLDPQHQTAMATIFSRAVAQGINILVASGDSGSDSCQDNTVQADWPAGAFNVVAVGGTSFSQNGAGLAETGWSGSGGGISAIWELPPWQSKLGSPYLKRSYPDVSFNADPSTGQGIWTESYGYAGWQVVGGTSMAAPQWAGFLALVGEARVKVGKTPVGFLNPIIYGLSDSDRNKAFNDVTSGNNGAYTAVSGWDAVTGMGSMKADALLKVLQNY